MKMHKSIVRTLFFPASCTLLILLFRASKGTMPDLENCMFLAFTFLSLWAAGLLLGVFLFAIFKRPSKEPYFYFTAQVLVLIVPAVFIYIMFRQVGNDTVRDSNSEHNHKIMLGLSATHEETQNVLTAQEIAFAKLEAQFSNKNDIGIGGYLTSTFDTVVNGQTDSVYSVYFEYTLGDTARKYAEVLVRNDSASIQVINGSINDERFVAKKAALQREIDTVLKSVEGAQKENLEDAKRPILRKLQVK